VLASGAVTRIGEASGEMSGCGWARTPEATQRRDERLPIPDHHAGIDRIIAGLRGSGVLATWASWPPSATAWSTAARLPRTDPRG
jgi:hypothetical protein